MLLLGLFHIEVINKSLGESAFFSTSVNILIYSYLLASREKLI